MPDAPWPRRLLYPTVAEVQAQFRRPMRPYQILLDPGEPGGYLRDWQPGGLTPQQHLAYSAQWFGLGVTLIILYVALNLKKVGTHG